MRYLKRYNEKLNPRTYRRAADIAGSLSHKDRETELRDYADEKEFGIYKMAFLKHAMSGGVECLPAQQSNMDDRWIGMTRPEFSVQFGAQKMGERSIFLPGGSIQAQDAISQWEEGKHPLCVSVLVSMYMTHNRGIEGGARNAASGELPHVQTRKKSAFIVQIDLSDYYWGLEEWKNDCATCGGAHQRECDECDGDGEECTYCNGTGMITCDDCGGRPVHEGGTAEMFEDTFMPLVRIRPASIQKSTYDGVMAVAVDRKTANMLKALLDKTLTSSVVMEKISDIVSILGADPEKMFEIMKTIGNVSANALLLPSDIDDRMKKAVRPY